MNNQEVVAVLEECKQMLDGLLSEVTASSEEEKNDYLQCEASLPDDLRTLIKEAKEMKWPFVPERWQYKQAIGPEDKTNLQNLINPRLRELLEFFKACIKTGNSSTAAAIVFLVDRFLYWADASTRLLSIAKALHKRWPTTPIAPQVVIRQARISVNSGKLLKAEYILGSLISNNGATGTWLYSEESDRILVQSVCIQIRGQILQKLGMWYQAAELIWASIVGFFELPIPDKKGIASSLGILADIFISMSEEEFQIFKKNRKMRLTLLDEFSHRLLSAAEACKLAAAFSLYTPLFVLTNLNIRGTCLLFYSLSEKCPTDKKMYFLSEAKESFEIGLLTKKYGDQVTSKQELHSFVKAAFCLANVHKWLNSEAGQEEKVAHLCKNAMEKLVSYNTLSDKHDKGVLSSDIMSLISSIKEHLKVKPFLNSDDQSFVPDSYKDCIKSEIINGKVDFNKLLDMYSQHHNSICKVFDVTCSNHTTMDDGIKSGACVTALKTTETISTIDSSPSHTATVQSDGKSARRGQLLRSDAISYSVEDRSNRLSSSHSGSQGIHLSNSSFSWECIPEHNENDLHVSNYEDDQVLIPTVSSENAPEKKLQDLSLEDKASGQQYKENNAASANRSSSYSDDGSFVEIYGDPEIGKQSTISKNLDTFNVNEAEQKLLYKTNLDGDTKGIGQLDGATGLPKQSKVDGKTQDIKDDLNFVITLPGPSGAPKIYSEIDLEGETQDTTDHGPDGQFGGCTGSRNLLLNDIDAEGITQDTTDNQPTALEGVLMGPPGPAGGTGPVNIYRTNLEGKRLMALPTLGDIGAQIHSGTHFEDETRRGIHSSVPANNSHGILCCGIDVKGDTKDTTEDAPCEIHDPLSIPVISSVTGSEGGTRYRTGPSTFLNNSPVSSDEKVIAIEDNLELQFLERQWSVESLTGKRSLDHQTSLSSSLSSSEKSKEADSSDKPCRSPDDADNKLSLILSSSQGSSSSSGSWYKVGQFSGSLSDSNSFLNSSSSSFVVIQSKHTEQIVQARTLDDTDYKNLLLGVTHKWLLDRLEKTGVFKFKHAQKTYDALLLKFSKNSGLWTAQETLVHFGKKVNVNKEGKQRDAFWISFLHQDETLGRYVGKAYKKHKELLYHFSDVERQMTAQFYVTEFNKRLYELNIPTQIFYIPSSVLLIMEGRTISSCVSVEPYILGEFVKLTNNTKAVRRQYEATKYGLAFGHFAYEYSKSSDIVVDLQGWVTGSEKGEALIYLTDPQIHSVEDRPGGSCINFGSRGIYMFFSYQHTECNEICKRLGLTRPDIK
ncbi:alpha-protein kinase 1 [Gastrophryne carolinensis]